MNEFVYDLIEKLEEKEPKEILAGETDPEYYYALSEARMDLFEWLPLRQDSEVLMIGAEYGAFCGLAEGIKAFDIFDPSENGIAVVRRRLGDRADNIGLFKNEPKKLYDAVLIPFIREGMLSSYGVSSELEPFLEYCSRFLKKDGCLIFAADNSDSLRYFAGKEKREGECCFSISEIKEAAGRLAFSDMKAYYPLPNKAFAKDIFSDRYLPGKGDFRGVSGEIIGSGMALCDEEALYGRLSEEGVFPVFAPAYLMILSGYSGTHIDELVLMSEPRARVMEPSELPVYIRYNSGRDQAYRIRTEIFEKDGELNFVRKTALSKKSNEHILSFEHKYELLRDTIENKELHILKPRIGRSRSGLMYADFEYLRGEKLSELLAREIKDGKAPLGRLRDELEFLMGRGLSPCHDLDLVFENVIVTDNGRWLIDYEWVFDTPPERDYVRYRILRYWYEAYKESLYAYDCLEDFFSEFGIKGELLSDCEEREASFQDFVNGDGEGRLASRYLTEPLTVSRIKADEEKLREYTEWNLRLQDEVEEHKTAIRKLHETERLSQNHIHNIENINAAREAEIERLNKEVLYLRKHRSLYARISGLLIRYFDRTAPQGSRKRKLLHYAHNTVKHPLKYLKLYFTAEGREFIAGDFAIGGEFEEGGLLTLPGVPAAPAVPGSPGPAGSPAAAAPAKEAEKPAEDPEAQVGEETAAASSEGTEEIKTAAASLEEAEKAEDEETAEAEKTAASEAPAILEKPESDVLVSIVLPAYNQVAYTYACIRSIIENTDYEETPYEVILADDVSTDATKDIGRFIKGLVISRSEENQGFLKNCNRAAKLARGRYIFFLNNDTKVKKGWLKSLTDMMEADESIGLCGSKLVYPDGRLQEAGGIIWSDASGWNYGRMDDPEKPEYNYVKDVDYISGAAIMIRRSLWEEIGGFDERYAPAYCEDSDLCFEVRKHGKRVVYQPRSVVVHFEGISNGTDVEGSGLKRYQKINNEKFREKWAEELKLQQENTGDPDPFTARDRSAGKKCILVIDHYVPTWDKDAGSRTTYQYIKLFLKQGFNVKFLGDNFLHEEPYTGELEQLGVEVLYGEEYRLGILDWIKKNAAHIDIAYLNRPHVAVKYIDFIKDNTDIRCIYYGHDLHFLRLEREYELTDDIKIKREADYWKSVELSVMDRADAVYYPSETEIEAIKELRPDIYCKAITAYVWDEFRDPDEDNMDRKDLLFVGGFAHPPNEDGLLWFARDVFPDIKKEIPDIRLKVAGSHVTEAVEELKKEDGMDILGFVSDEELKKLYETSAIVVVPLRYGAGVKGKVVEALYYGSVVITTEVGAEGIPEADSAMAVVHPEEGTAPSDYESIAGSFAEDVIKLYKDRDFCRAIRARALAHVKEHYSTEAAWQVIKKDFG